MSVKSVAYFDEASCDITEFEKICEQALTNSDVPLATDIQKNIPIYEMTSLDLTTQRKSLMSEWADNLLNGSGIVVLKNAYADTSGIDAATEHYNEIIAIEEAAGGDKGDHFAKAGANSRIWNSLEKLCLKSPETFAGYFNNGPIDAICEAWLGPAYQMTAQVNVVRPGGKAQEPHRDYHLGFMTAAQAGSYPAHTHLLSPALTLQGAIAHVDMPVVSGPTKLLPFSQKYPAGYLAWRRDDFKSYFEENYVQLPLNKGDAVFFSPALFHAAGDNNSEDIQRMVNLLQTSSAMGRSMETVDRTEMCKLLYPVLKDLNLPEEELRVVIANSAEGYPFPTNLDIEQPEDGLAPESQAAKMSRFLREGRSTEEFLAALSIEN